MGTKVNSKAPYLTKGEVFTLSKLNYIKPLKLSDLSVPEIRNQIHLRIVLDSLVEKNKIRRLTSRYGEFLYLRK